MTAITTNRTLFRLKISFETCKNSGFFKPFFRIKTIELSLISYIIYLK